MGPAGTASGDLGSESRASSFERRLMVDDDDDGGVRRLDIGCCRPAVRAFLLRSEREGLSHDVRGRETVELMSLCMYVLR
jgi:hypothetical protein